MGRQNALQTLYYRRQQNTGTIGKMHIFHKYRESLDLTIREHKLIFWRRITHILKDLKITNKDMINNNTSVIETENDVNDTTWSGTYLHGQVNAIPVSDRETCTRGREVLRIYADVAIGI